MQVIPLPPIYTGNQAQCRSLCKSTSLNPTAVEYVSSTTPVPSLPLYVQPSAPIATAVTRPITTMAPTLIMAQSISSPLLPWPPPPLPWPPPQLQQPIVVPYVQLYAPTASEVIHPKTTMESEPMAQSIPLPILSQPSPSPPAQPIGSKHMSYSSVTFDCTINSVNLI